MGTYLGDGGTSYYADGGKGGQESGSELHYGIEDVGIKGANYAPFIRKRKEPGSCVTHVLR